MIDFQLNNIGDIVFKENAKRYPKLRINFEIASVFPRLKVDFNVKQLPAINNGLKINFLISAEAVEHGSQYIPCVRKKEEKAQSISIRLKTELNELSRYYGSFGSELIRLRHSDLKDAGTYDMAKEYTSYAISDIISADKQDIRVQRKITKDGKFQLATVGIDVFESPQSKIYEYEI